MVICKSTQWEYEGKEIYIGDEVSEPASTWSQKLSFGQVQFTKITDNEGNPTHSQGLP